MLPPHEPVTAGKALQSLEKFEAAEAWIPAFAGTAKAEVANFFISVLILAQPRSVFRQIGAGQRRITLRSSALQRFAA
jgi:hypothetical protein